MKMELPVGRDAELATIDAFLDGRSAGFGGLWVEGDAGIGKTTVWQGGVERARNRAFTVLVARPAEAEWKLSFSGLADLVEPIDVSLFAALPGPQRVALEVALHRRAPEGLGPDTRALGGALRTLLVGLAATSPVLIAVDDFQWLDSASAAAVAFALRRIGTERVGLLATHRTTTNDDREAFGALGVDLQVLRLTPLSLGGVHQMLKARLGTSLPRPVLLRVYEATAGNPFYALEIAREQLASRPRAGDPLHVPRDLNNAVQRRLRRLSTEARAALVVVAALAHPTPALVEEVLGADPRGLLEEVESAGVIELDQARIRFSHPLYAAAVLAMSPPRERRRTHRQLAEVVLDRQERARHLALSTVTPDANVASELETAGNEARRRAAPEAAIELFDLAISLTPTGDKRLGDRWVALGECLLQAGDMIRAGEVFERGAAEASTNELRVRAWVGIAAAKNWGEGSHAGVAACEQALALAAGTPVLEALCHADLAIYCHYDLERSERHAREAVALCEALGPGADPSLHAQALATAIRASLVRGRGLSVSELERAADLAAQATPHWQVSSRLVAMSGQWLKYADQLDQSRERLEETRRLAIAEGDESSLPNVLMHLGQCELWLGNWGKASEYAEESVLRADGIGQPLSWVVAFRADIDAHLGRAARATSAVNDLMAGSSSAPDHLTRAQYLRVLGFVELSLGNAVAAGQYLLEALSLADESGVLEPGVLRIHANAIEALTQSAELDAARELAATLQARAAMTNHPWATATSLRCRALLLSADRQHLEALSLLERATEVERRLQMPFERARTILVRGQIQRRAKKRSAAGRSLHEATVRFEALGAQLWADTAKRELARVGRAAGASQELTASEQRVAELAATGLTNREVAARLYVSPKTVEANLARVYRKLGIHSRAELGARLGEPGTRQAM